MTTWELASEEDMGQIRRLIDQIERHGHTLSEAEKDLANLTKKRAGAMLTHLRQLLRELESR